MVGNISAAPDVESSMFKMTASKMTEHGRFPAATGGYQGGMSQSADIQPIITLDDRVGAAAHLVGNHGFEVAERIMLVSMRQDERIDRVEERLAG